MIEIKDFSDEDIQYITDNYQNMTQKELAENLNRSYKDIKYVISKLGITKQVHNKWTEEEIEFLKEHYIDMTSEEISKYINHSVNAINTQRDRLGLVRNKAWTDEEEDFLKANYNKKSHKELGGILNKTESAIRAKCFDLNLYKKEKPWTQEELDFVKENYMEMPTRDISKILNRTTNAVTLRAERMGLKKYPYMCDYNFFSDINTEEKAYWLGFLIADGWISINETSSSAATGIELQYGDINHLKKFNKSLHGNYKITDRWKTCSLSDSNKKHHICCIRIFSLTMYRDLEKLGFASDKTYSCCIPNIDEELLRHFFRGYFDGDGCFTLTNKSFKVSFLTASKTLNDDIMRTLKNNWDPGTYTYISESGTTMYRIELYKKKEKLEFLDWIYKDAKVFLDRKYKKYIKAKERYAAHHVCLAS